MSPCRTCSAECCQYVALQIDTPRSTNDFEKLQAVVFPHNGFYFGVQLNILDTAWSIGCIWIIQDWILWWYAHGKWYSYITKRCQITMAITMKNISQQQKFNKKSCKQIFHCIIFVHSLTAVMTGIPNITWIMMYCCVELCVLSKWHWRVGMGPRK